MEPDTPCVSRAGTDRVEHSVCVCSQSDDSYVQLPAFRLCPFPAHFTSVLDAVPATNRPTVQFACRVFLPSARIQRYCEWIPNAGVQSKNIKHLGFDGVTHSHSGDALHGGKCFQSKLPRGLFLSQFVLTIAPFNAPWSGVNIAPSVNLASLCQSLSGQRINLEYW